MTWMLGIGAYSQFREEFRPFTPAVAEHLVQPCWRADRVHPFDAIRTFDTCGMDALVIGNYVWRRPDRHARGEQ